MAVNPVLRIRLISLAIFLFSVLLIARLFFLQVVKSDFYTERADRQYQRPAATLAERGVISFRQKDGQLVSAASMRDGFLAAINPRVLQNPEAVYERLSSLVDLDRDVFSRATQANATHREIATKLNEKQAETIKSWEIPGLGVLKSRWRFYPAGRTASHVLGLVNYEGEGVYGLEKEYDDVLVRDEDQTFSSFLAEVLSDVGSALFSRDTNQTEADLVLTIEPVVQDTLETELSALKDKYNAESAGAVIMDPVTGEIIAMAALPDFDPGARQSSLEPLANPLVERTYEMGSTFKPLTMAAALDAGVVKASTTYDDRGTLTINNKVISNYDGRARGVVPMQEVLNQSLNTGVVFAMQKLGQERFRNYVVNFGLTEETGVDLPGEVVGNNNNLLQSNREIEYATASYGQGITVTPLALTRALAALANGGRLVRPHVVAEIKRHDSKLSELTQPELGRQVIKPETSKEITRMLVEVVDTALVGGKYKMDRYRIAAKTGTAQQARLSGGGYDPERFLHSFFGYFPASDPQFIIFIYLVRPIGARYASDTLSAPFMSLTKFLLNYYNVPPDR